MTLAAPTPPPSYAVAQLTTLKAAWDARARIMAPCAEDAPTRDEARALVVERCRRDPVYFLEALGWTYDPRLGAEGLRPYVPLMLYPRQRELIAWLEQRRTTRTHGAVSKGRGVGASWVCFGYSLWLWCTQQGTAIMWGSRTEADVDRLGDPKSLFEKGAIFIERMPTWARDALIPGWSLAEHRHHKRLIHPSNGSTIVGEIGQHMGRSGRCLMYFWDEAAHHPHAVAVDRAVKETTASQIDLSTPNGASGPFAHKVLRKTVETFTFSWRDVPWRDDAWLADKRAEYAHDTEGMAQEVLGDFGASDGARIIATSWVEASLVSASWDVRAPVVMGLDVSTSSDRTVAVIRQGARVLAVESRGGAGGEEIGRWALGLAVEWQVERLCFDAIGVGEGVSTYFALAAPRMDVVIIPVTVSERPTQTWWPGARKTAQELFVNLRAELWWMVRERFRRVARDELASPGEGICLHGAPSDLVDEIGWIRRAPQLAGGKIAIERKDDLRKRVGRSPDHVDALVMAYADDVLYRPAAGVARAASRPPLSNARRQRIREW